MSGRSFYGTLWRAADDEGIANFFDELNRARTDIQFQQAQEFIISLKRLRGVAVRGLQYEETSTTLGEPCVFAITALFSYSITSTLIVSISGNKTVDKITALFYPQTHPEQAITSTYPQRIYFPHRYTSKYNNQPLVYEKNKVFSPCLTIDLGQDSITSFPEDDLADYLWFAHRYSPTLPHFVGVDVDVSMHKQKKERLQLVWGYSHAEKIVNEWKEINLEKMPEGCLVRISPDRRRSLVVFTSSNKFVEMFPHPPSSDSVVLCGVYHQMCIQREKGRWNAYAYQPFAVVTELTIDEILANQKDAECVYEVVQDYWIGVRRNIKNHTATQ